MTAPLVASPITALDASLYDLIETSEEDIPLWLELARAAQGPVLELGCGTGRVMAPLARAGVRVVGVDRSEAMLDRARARGLRDLVRADLESFAVEERFALAIGPARVLEHVADAGAALRAVRRHLLPGGRLALHVAGPPSDTQPEVSAVRVRRARAGEVVLHERLDRQARVRTITLVLHASSGPRAFGPLRLHWHDSSELDALLHASGFEPIRDPEPEPRGGLRLVVARALEV